MENFGKCTNEKNFINCFFLLLPANLNAENISKVYFAGVAFGAWKSHLIRLMV